jgi:hypothetical protein
VDSAWEQEKLEDGKTLENGNQSSTFSVYHPGACQDLVSDNALLGRFYAYLIV